MATKPELNILFFSDTGEGTEMNVWYKALREEIECKIFSRSVLVCFSKNPYIFYEILRPAKKVESLELSNQISGVGSLNSPACTVP